ncbi:hypothetical protein CPARA_3gp388 (nucleomorph) [Cryptomonas paramecium]|uniref:Uncharacterized protein n=1 Tax=Cryptomonas paramaecium TaxID=2898 RepID=F2HIC2_9CRYP|nr:hypothetical protein CPARA_3gp388 [Cryptomonas paramecium]AEA39046.1 hypothetical protein CPARA_3gp388 [Cryptomonas paramecium]
MNTHSIHHVPCFSLFSTTRLYFLFSIIFNTICNFFQLNILKGILYLNGVEYLKFKEFYKKHISDLNCFQKNIFFNKKCLNVKIFNKLLEKKNNIKEKIVCLRSIFKLRNIKYKKNISPFFRFSTKT